MPRSPDILGLARKWIEAAGDTVQVVEIPLPEGGIASVLQVTHGTVTVQLTVRGDLVLIGAGFEVPVDSRQKLGTLPGETQVKLLLGLRVELESCHRVGFVLMPPTAANISQVERFIVSEVVYISADDPSTRNRLMDAIQEISTVGVRGAQVLGIAELAAGSTSVTTGSPRGQPPPGMFG